MKKAKITLVGLLLATLMIVSIMPLSNAVYVPINLTVTVTKGIAMADGHDQGIIDVTVTGARYVVVTTDEGKSQTGNYFQTTQRYYLTFSENKLRRAQIKVEAYGTGTYAVKYVYIRIQFNVTATNQETWFDRAHDYARSHSSSNTLQDKIALWDSGWEFVKFTHVKDPDAYSLSGLTPSQAIYALHIWAKDYFSYFWTSSDVSRTAIEVNQNFVNFNGDVHNKDNYNITKQDCTSMAAFLSGVATAFGLPSRMISDEVASRYYQHMFVEIYGYSVNNNNGWFLIDPAGGSSTSSYLSSFDSVSTIRNAYSESKLVLGQVKYIATRFHFIWGMTSSGWGEQITGTSRMTYWVGYASPPYKAIYNPNPWGITLS